MGMDNRWDEDRFLEPRLEEERRRREGISFRVNDEENPETEVERRQKLGIFAAIAAVAALVLGFYAFFRVITTEAAVALIDTAVGWFAVVALLAGIAMAIVAVASFVSADPYREA